MTIGYRISFPKEYLYYFQDSSGQYWIGSWEHGLFTMNGTTIHNFRHQENDPASISSNFIRCCTEDKQGNIWIGTSTD